MIFYTIPKTAAFSGGMQILDMLPFGYSPGYVQLLFERLGEGGRHFYLTRQIPVDMLYPLLFAVTYALLLAFLLRKLGWGSDLISILCIVPMAAGIFDYLENIGIIVMLKAYPDISPGTARVTAVFSTGKSLATMVFWLLALYALVALIVRSMRSR